MLHSTPLTHQEPVIMCNVGIPSPLCINVVIVVQYFGAYLLAAFHVVSLLAFCFEYNSKPSPEKAQMGV